VRGGGKKGFCWNSRRWVVLMDLRMSYPEACPSRGMGCAGCSYFEEREQTAYVRRVLRILSRWPDG